MEGKVGYENCRSECLSNKNEDSNLRTCMATEWNDQNYKYHTSIFSCWTFFSLSINTSYLYLTTFIHDSWVSKIMFVVPKKIMKSSEPAQIKADEEARLQQLEEQSGCKEKFHSPKLTWNLKIGGFYTLFLFQGVFLQVPCLFSEVCPFKILKYVLFISYFSQSSLQLEMLNLWKDTGPGF